MADRIHKLKPKAIKPSSKLDLPNQDMFGSLSGASIRVAKSNTSIVNLPSIASIANPVDLGTASFQRTDARGHVDCDSLAMFQSVSNIGSSFDCVLSDGDIPYDVLEEFLITKPQVLDDYIMDRIPLAEIITWVDKKIALTAQNYDTTTFIDRDRYTRYVELDMQQLSLDITKCLEEDLDPLPIWFELSRVMGRTVCSDFTTLYQVPADKRRVMRYIPSHKNDKYKLQEVDCVGKGGSLAGYVAYCKRTVVTSDHMADDRFPRGTGIAQRELARAAMAVPVVLQSGDIVAILEFSRRFERPGFSRLDMEAATALGFTEKLFHDVVFLNPLAEKIMVYAKELVKADRCAFFRVDHKRQELFSNLLDKGEVNEKGESVFTKSNEIRFSVKFGIAGHVARTGQVVNIPVAYKDPRFNREIDFKTGYTTKNILCMPIVSDKLVIGVVQLINKIGNDGFTKADESSFKIFSVYCALALHYSSVLEDLRVERANKVIAREQLFQHIHTDDVEVDNVTANVKRMSKNSEMLCKNYLASFTFHVSAIKDCAQRMPYLFIKMCSDVLHEHQFNVHKLAKLILTVVKSYRHVPFHTIENAWSCAQFIYAFLQNVNRERLFFTALRKKALLLTALVHDVDHRGISNSFYQKTKHAVCSLYEGSLMENHHYYHFTTLLSMDGCDVLDDLSEEERDQVLNFIKDAILATDLTNVKRRQQVLGKTLMSRGNEAILRMSDYHNDVLEMIALCMDLSIILKPWGTYQDLILKFYEELYQQGDIEKNLKFKPSPAMDRDRESLRPALQTNFLEKVVLQQFDILEKIFPELGPKVFTSLVRDNIHNWKNSALGKATSMWEPAKSLPPQAKYHFKPTSDMEDPNVVPDLPRIKLSATSVHTANELNSELISVSSAGVTNITPEDEDDLPVLL